MIRPDHEPEVLRLATQHYRAEHSRHALYITGTRLVRNTVVLSDHDGAIAYLAVTRLSDGRFRFSPTVAP